MPQESIRGQKKARGYYTGYYTATTLATSHHFTGHFTPLHWPLHKQEVCQEQPASKAGILLT